MFGSYRDSQTVRRGDNFDMMLDTLRFETKIPTRRTYHDTSEAYLAN